MKTVPSNLALHEHLMSLGYVHTHYEASWEDDGDAESGPHLIGGPSYDEYVGTNEVVYSSEDGVLDREPRDLNFERWCDEQHAGGDR